MMEEVSGEDKYEFDARCDGGVTPISIYIHPSGWDPEMCDACEMPETGGSSSSSGDSQIYVFELPCDTQCIDPTAAPTSAPTSGPTAGPTSSPTGTPTTSPAPTNCVDPMGADVTDGPGVDGSDGIPGTDEETIDGIVLIEFESDDGETMIFKAVQVFPEDVLDVTSVSVEYPSGPDGATSCDKSDVGTAVGSSAEYTATCDNFVATVSVYFYTGSDEFSTCLPPGADGANTGNDPTVGGTVYKFTFSVPCQTECIDPTAAPTSAPTSSPTSAPTDIICEYDIIDFSIDGEGNAIDPAATPYALTTVYDDFGLAIEVDPDYNPNQSGYGGPQGFNPRFWATGDPTAGTAMIIQESNIAAAIPNGGGGRIIITLEEALDEDMQVTLFDVIGTGGTIETFDSSSTLVATLPIAASPAGTSSYVVDLRGDVEQVVITFVKEGALAELGICRNKLFTKPPDGGSPPSSDTTVPTLMPTTSPAPSSNPTHDGYCPEDVKVLNVVGHTEPDEIPIKIVSQNATTVTFDVFNAWTEREITYLYDEFHVDQVGSTDCYNYENITKSFVTRHTAYCFVSKPITIVNIWVSGPGFVVTLDNAEVPECCDPPEGDAHPKVQYTFLVWCKPQCPDDYIVPKPAPSSTPGRQLHSVPASTTNSHNEKVVEPVHGHKHSCEPAEHPCGDDANFVHICHYSSKLGFQTFCVPESDSDVVGYYPRDSCGPCAQEGFKVMK